MDKIEIGVVAKPQGIKGELKIRLFADSFEQVSAVKEVEINGIVYSVQSFKQSAQEEAILKVVGLDDRNLAELLRGKEVYADRSELINEEGRFFVSDVIGCTLFLSSGKEIGKIYDIVNGNVDYYYIETSEGKAVIPLIKQLSAVFDIPLKKVIVDAKEFTKVVMYEN